MAAASGALHGGDAAGGGAYTLTSVNPLSIPRGIKLIDELTGESPARLVATIAGNSFYYSSQQSFQLDYDGILCKIAPLLAQLSSLATMMGTAVERAVRAKKVHLVQREIAGVCERTAQALLQNKEYELAVPPSLRCLRALLVVHGEGAVELVPAYLVLAEVNLGLARVTQADEFLSTANYILLKNPGAATLLRSRLHRNFGRMHAARGDNAAALASFARDVFYASMVHGPEAIDVAVGYFFMAQVMAAQGQMENSLALFDRVVDAWYKHLLGERSPISVALGVDFRARSPESYLGDARASGFLARSAAMEAAAAAGVASGAAAAAADSAVATRGANGGGAASASAAGEAAAAALPQAAGAPAATPPAPVLSEANIREGLEILEFVMQIRTTQLGAHHTSTAEARYTLALILWHAGRFAEAKVLLGDALAVFSAHLAETDPMIVKIRGMLKA